MNHKIHINPVKNPKYSEVDLNSAPFGKVFSDHMFVAEYADGEWKNARIEAYGNLTLSPANLTLHYGQTIFEGMKSFRGQDGQPLLFRLDKHIERLNASAHRMAMPDFPKQLFYDAIHQLLQLDHNWIPDSPNALYIRPFMFATDEYIGVKPSSSYKFMIITGPVGNYYDKPVKLLTAQKYMRAAKGGLGAAKTAANYAASLYPMKIAKEAGYDQLLWMASDFKTIQECGTMNVFFQIGDTVITPSVEGDTILKGITRDSFIQILRGEGHKVEEREITIDEVVEAYHSGELKDVFGSGTAAVVAMVSELTYQDLTMKLPAVDDRKISNFLKKELDAIRTGKSPDKFNWVEKVNVNSTVS